MTLELAQEMAVREGIDLYAVDVEDEAEQRRLNREAARAHKCCSMAKDYAEMVDDWFNSVRAESDENEDVFAEIQEEIATADPLGTSVMCDEAVEVIGWYQHQIYVKLMGAVEGSQME
jgi:hypothetical protein